MTQPSSEEVERVAQAIIAERYGPHMYGSITELALINRWLDEARAAISAMPHLDEIARLRGALEPFAKDRLSTEAMISDLLLRPPGEVLRIRAGDIELRDAQIRAARAALAQPGESA